MMIFYVYTKNVKVHNLRQTVPRITEYTREKKREFRSEFPENSHQFSKKIEKQKIENSREYFEPSAHEPSFDVAQVFYNFPRRKKNDTDSKPFVKKSDFNDST